MFRIVVFCALLYMVAAIPSSKLPFACSPPTSVEVEGCNFPERCLLIRGQEAVVHIKFTNTRNTGSLSTTGTINMTIGGISFPMLYVLNDNTCNGLTNAQCPVRAGQELEYTLRVPVNESIPVHFLTMIRLTVTDDESGQTIFCTDVPIVIG